MKIAYVLNTYPQPSQSFIRREITALEAQGHEVMRLAMRAGDAPLVDPLDQGEAARTQYILKAGAMGLARACAWAFAQGPARFTAALRQAWAFGAVSEVGRLRHLIYLAEAAEVAARCQTAGIRHTHAHFGTNAATVAMLAHTLGGPRFSFTVHGPEEFDAPRALSLRDKIAASAFTVAISSYGRSQLCRWSDSADWERIKVVHCGVEPARFADPVPLPDGPRRVVAIGRLVEQKGQLALIDALAKTQSDMHLTLIGDGEMRSQIDAAVARHALQDRVTLTGWVGEDRIRDELARAHALVMPSFAEGLPMVVMEAMAAARPVIATHVAGTPELVQDGGTGWLVPAGDTDALAQAMDRMAQSPLADLSAMGEAGRARVLARHDVAQEAEKLAGFFAAP
ncbi:glycosyltransferase family 4 protein [Sulfitobacter sp. JB4-11]|uniref:glycosyltransferase family 4 protein n=1 Tax=Sulfitobacter rhodophyticola TaxID=3238304 RepID=UPI00351887C8